MLRAKHHTSLLFAVTGLVVILLPLLAACGVAQQDYDAVKQQLAAKEQDVASLKQQVDAAKAAATQQAGALQQQLKTKESEAGSLKQQLDSAKAAGQQVTTLQQRLAAKEAEAADLQKKIAAAAGKTTVIWAEGGKPIPKPPPPPAPLPAGVTPAPKPRPDAAFINEVVPFAFYVETLATSSVSPYGFASYPACVPNSQFKRGVKIVWRFEVFDTSTGKRLTDPAQAAVTVNLPHGQDLVANFSRRAGTGPWTWVTAWDIPLDYPLGAFDYTITVVTKDGRKGMFKMPALVNKDRGIDSRLSIVD
ncbi:MAG: hypothetical protein HY673_00650 [Chloroflexi bacterium]|nr:hypothetical protein [Chloroflexota bacterium]